jgi:hypothetical protein
MRNWACFLLGNLWLLMAFVLLLGRKVVRVGPLMYSFFGVGGWLSPFAYGFLIVACALIGVGLMFLGNRPTNVSNPR